MTRFHTVGRRNFLIGAGGAALALPALHALGGGRAQAQGTPPRLLVLYHPIGTIPHMWTPEGTGRDYAMSPLLAPLARHREDMLVLSGIENRMIRALDPGVSHAAGAISMLTQQPMSGVIGPDGRHTGIETIDPRPPIGPSFDQVIADHVHVEGTIRSLHLAVGGPFVGEYAAFWRMDEGAELANAVSLEPDPRVTFERYLRGVGSDPDPAPEPAPPSFRERLRQHSGSVLDANRREIRSFMATLPREDVATFQQHLSALEELEGRLRVGGGGGPVGTPPLSCEEPSLMGTPGGERWFERVENSIPAFEQQLEVLAMSFACGLTRVGALQFTHSHGQRFVDVPGYNVPSPGNADWHAMVHSIRDSDGREFGMDNLLFQGYEWYSHRVASVIDRLKSIPEGDGTLLDNTIVLWLSEFGDGSHDVSNMPVVLFGGPLPKGQHLDFRGRNMTELFIGLAERFGLPLTSFGLGSYIGESFEDAPIDLAT